MKPCALSLLRPKSLADALDMLGRHKGNVKIIAGGQSLVPMMNFRMVTPEILIDIGALAELREVSVASDGLTIGAGVRQSRLVEDATFAAEAPLLAKAAAHIGHVQTRARGTIGGSIAHADPAAEIPTVAVAVDAVIIAKSLRGERHIRARDFFLSALTTCLEDDELITEIRFPAARSISRLAFGEISRREGDFAIVSAAVQAEASGTTWTVNAALGGVSDTPCFCAAIHARSPELVDKSGIDSAVDAEVERLAPVSDMHASADYRRHLARVLLTQCLEEVLRP